MQPASLAVGLLMRPPKALQTQTASSDAAAGNQTNVCVARKSRMGPARWRGEFRVDALRPSQLLARVIAPRSTATGHFSPGHPPPPPWLG